MLVDLGANLHHGLAEMSFVRHRLFCKLVNLRLLERILWGHVVELYVYNYYCGLHTSSQVSKSRAISHFCLAHIY